MPADEDQLPQDDVDETLQESEYSKKTEFQKDSLASTQVERILEKRSKDLRAGYTTWFTDRTGESHPQIIQDTRKEFVSSVEALKNLLSPEIKQQNLNIEKNYQEEKKRIFNKYAYHERIGKGWNKDKNGRQVAVWIYSGRTYLPQKGASILVDDPKMPHSCNVQKLSCGWDDLIDAYWDELVESADQLFQELNDLIHKLEYFKGGSSL